MAILQVAKYSGQDFPFCSKSGQKGIKSNYRQPQLNFSFSLTEGP